MRKFSSFLTLMTVLSIHAFSQVPTDSLVSYYPFSGNANDMSGHGNNGIVHGAVLTMDRFGNENSAYKLDGVDDYIDFSHKVSSFNIQQPASISFWVKTNSDIPQTIFAISDSTYASFNISAIFVGNNTTGTMDNELVNVANRMDSYDDYILGYTTAERFWLIDNNWHHIVVVYNNQSTQIYLDKHLLPLTNYKTNTGHFGKIPTANKVTLGARYSNGLGAYLNGALDEFRMYHKALDSTEIAALYNDGSGVCFEKISVTDTLVINANLTSSNPVHFLNTIKIYPNPAKDHIYIDTDKNSQGYQIKIVNALSQVVYETTITQGRYDVNLKTWTNKGTYFVQFYDNNGILKDVKKIILQ